MQCSGFSGLPDQLGLSKLFLTCYCETDQDRQFAEEGRRVGKGRERKINWEIGAQHKDCAFSESVFQRCGEAD